MMYSQSDGRPPQETSNQINIREALNYRPTQTDDPVPNIFFVSPPNKAKRQIYHQIENATKVVISKTIIAEAYSDMLLTNIGRIMWTELSGRNNKNVNIFITLCPTAQLRTEETLATTTRHRAGVNSQLNFEAFVYEYGSELNNFKGMNLPTNSYNFPLALISYGEEHFNQVQSGPYYQALNRLQGSIIFFHELYAHVKMHFDDSQTYDQDDGKKEHEAFGQTYYNLRLEKEKPAGKFVLQLLEAWEKKRINFDHLEHLKEAYFS